MRGNIWINCTLILACGMVDTSLNITVMVLPHTVKSPGMYRNIVTNYYNNVINHYVTRLGRLWEWQHCHVENKLKYKFYISMWNFKNFTVTSKIKYQKIRFNIFFLQNIVFVTSNFNYVFQCYTNNMLNS